ncbi:MAG TPA: hypothetical protein VFE60_14635 [Roseiarcus sp.]|nr:hypothetical protein [Roseiarcus sp.]
MPSRPRCAQRHDDADRIRPVLAVASAFLSPEAAWRATQIDEDF